jgi:hypothetical protein
MEDTATVSAVTDSIFALAGLSYFHRGRVNMFPVKLHYLVGGPIR